MERRFSAARTCTELPRLSLRVRLPGVAIHVVGCMDRHVARSAPRDDGLCSLAYSTQAFWLRSPFRDGKKSNFLG
jgi:hypothetical protein